MDRHTEELDFTFKKNLEFLMGLTRDWDTRLEFGSSSMV
jgi:hypothetical protein